MKSAGPELLGSSHLQSARLSRAWTAQQKMGTPSASPTVSNAGAATAFASFRLFLNMEGSLSMGLATGESEPEGLDSRLESSTRSRDHAAKSSESSTTRKHSDRSEGTKSDSFEQSVTSPTTSTTMQATVGVGEAPVVSILPSALSQPSADLHPSAGEMSPAAAQTLPIVSSSSQAQPLGQSAKLASEPTISLTADVSSVTASFAASLPSRATSDVRSLSLTSHPNGDGSKSHMQEDAQQDVSLDSASATHDLGTRIAPSPSTSQETPFRVAKAEVQNGQSVSKAQPALQVNQTQAVQPGTSKVLSKNGAEPARPQVAVGAATNQTHTESTSMAHEILSRPVAASSSTDASHLTQEIPSVPTVGNTSPGANNSDGAVTFRRPSMNRAGFSEPLTILENNVRPPTSAWTHAATTKVEAGFQDPSLGWVGVRATADSNGVHAAVLPSSPDASRMLGGSMEDLGAYLTEQHHSVQSLTMAPPPSAEAGNTGSSYDGAGLAQGNAQERSFGQQSGTNSEAAPETQTDRESLNFVSRENLDLVVSSAIYSAPGGALISVFA